jgi:hypothetical protein
MTFVLVHYSLELVAQIRSGFGGQREFEAWLNVTPVLLHQEFHLASQLAVFLVSWPVHPLTILRDIRLPSSGFKLEHST